MARFMSQVIRCTGRHMSLGEGLHAKPTSLSSRSLVRHIATTHCCAVERKYTDKHEWVIVEGKIGTVGISDYAQEALGDVVYAQLPDIGSVFKQEEECGALESVKAASEIMSPCSGKVIEKNDAVESKPGLINESCYNEGWLFKMELSDPEEINNLMDEKAYKRYLETDPH